MKIIEGGVCAAKGFKAGAMRCGIRKSHTKKDLAMILSDCVCNASAVYTTNRVKASPILLTKEHLADGKAQAVIVNSGNANACAPFGMENARRQAKAGARALGVSEENVIVASTGVIGQTLPVEAIEAHAGEMEMKYDNSLVAAEAIMTTDTKVKTIAVEFDVDGTTCHIGGICKGSGMIHPNMGTMLCFITTDCAVSSEMIRKALLFNVKRTFNRVTVDGDTSTNDMCTVLANGMAGNAEITAEDPAYEAFREALQAVMQDLARKIAAEVILFADKICTDEEVVRLKSHIQHMKETLEESNGIGRKLDFIAQEMNREANTILSKANDLDISNRALSLKTEIEKIREQIQNIE